VNPHRKQEGNRRIDSNFSENYGDDCKEHTQKKVLMNQLSPSIKKVIRNNFVLEPDQELISIFEVKMAEYTLEPKQLGHMLM
jgi:hypothetical protein